MEERGTPAYVAEFIGTFFLVLFVCLVVTLNSAGGLGVTDFAVIGLVHAFVLAMLVYTLGGTSGAHFNPAVTAALAALRKITLIDATIYWLVQLAGAVAAALVTKLLLLDEGRRSPRSCPATWARASCARCWAHSCSCGRSWAWRSTRGASARGPAG